ncbi:MAG: hypothetical protein HY815_23810 [Candidatus Riflebacteria bacterium]|nr:hypothetical protein [Candidatus Riflebacteria bacterium]
MQITSRERLATGASLVEAVLAILILSVAYLPLAELFHMTSQQTIKSRNHLVAQHLASDLFELYRVKENAILKALSGSGLLKTDDLLASAEVRSLLTGGARPIEDVIAFGTFKMAVEIERSVDGRTGLDRIETTVEWLEDGQRRSRTYARLVAP